MTSVERVMEYTELENEAAWETQKPPPGWPNKGLITFDQVNFSYSAKGPPVLKNLTAMFKPKEKVSQKQHMPVMHPSPHALIKGFWHCKSINMELCFYMLEALCYG